MQITVHAGPDNTTGILTLLEQMGYSLPCNCNGRHLCSGNTYSFDCAMIPKEDIHIDLPASVSGGPLVFSGSGSALTSPDVPGHSQNSGPGICGIALEQMPFSDGPADTLLIDLGTTTIALVLMDRSSGSLRQKTVFANPQRTLGSDIISRIQASCDGSRDELASLAADALRHQTLNLCRKNKTSIHDLKTCMIGGNTAMTHLLMKYDCHPLSAAPFQPAYPSPDPFTTEGVQVQILPWISGFIGGDITAGILACHLDARTASDAPVLFVDLGTNGEMILSTGDKLFTAATAAGPALEGASLSCGTAAIPGAICEVSLRRGRARTKTIDNKLPIGLCGSGAVSLSAELIRQGYVDKDGILTPDFPDNGISLGMPPHGTPLVFTVEDFRQMQLAAASIGAGIDALCHAANLSPDRLSEIILAGGFGFFISVSDAITLRMLPPLAADRIHAVGNSCLQGLYRCATENIPVHETFSFLSRIIPVNLAEDTFFRDRFVDHMTYPDDVISTTNS